jgi:SAM-dependent MidA family methyltransferase
LAEQFKVGFPAFMNRLQAQAAAAQALPEPDPAARAHSERLRRAIEHEIAAAGGSVSFARYMELALYAPGLGYYSAGARKFGAAGDFITAPELSPLFGKCLAHQCRQVLAALGGGEILELGAGSGALACELLSELARLDSLPRAYYILEVSADMRERQAQRIAERVPELADRVAWLDELPAEPIAGVILGNEVLDALPAHCVEIHGDEIRELRAGCAAGRFVWRYGRPEATLEAAMRRVIGSLREPLPRPYRTEINLLLPGWLRAVAAVLERGLILFIDYGYPRAEYYHPQRADGTLLCHYRHRAHADPFVYPGLQDITVSVDFTAVAEAAAAADLAVAGYTTQAHFLIGCGIDRLLAESDPADARAYLPLAQQAKTLVLPGEMGERFKAIALTRDLDIALNGFQRNDQRVRL